MSRYQQPYLSKYHTFNDVNICHKYFSGFAYLLTMHQCTSISLLSGYFTSSSMRVYVSDTVFRVHPQSLATCRVAHDLVARSTGVDLKKGCEKKRRKKREEEGEGGLRVVVVDVGGDLREQGTAGRGAKERTRRRVGKGSGVVQKRWKGDEGWRWGQYTRNLAEMHLDATARRSALLSLLCARKGKREREKRSSIAPEIGLLAKISMIFFLRDISIWHGIIILLVSDNYSWWEMKDDELFLKQYFHIIFLIYFGHRGIAIIIYYLIRDKQMRMERAFLQQQISGNLRK